jgi:AbrB family looped-hinge helix DNA binding protein
MARRKKQEPFIGKHLFGKGRVSSKGWVVIPKEIRDEMGLHEGDEVQFMLVPPPLTMKQDRALMSLRVSRVPEDPASVAWGMFPQQPGQPSWTEQLLDDRRRELERDEREIAAALRRRRKRSA